MEEVLFNIMLFFASIYIFYLVTHHIKTKHRPKEKKKLLYNYKLLIDIEKKKDDSEYLEALQQTYNTLALIEVVNKSIVNYYTDDCIFWRTLIKYPESFRTHKCSPHLWG